ncbi:hypothetical protein F4801DRAFT_525629 [Xylaria longipes]|nr:hypothetical protein F4801DRAFT_525629 [Xylaria longipes]RYC63032.1 hypothetical protein CHU98_g3201 [Xylaria longipes]
MAQNWHDAPEVAPQQNFPEVYYPKPTPVAPYPREQGKETSRRFCGCSILVLALSAIIALLFAAVIGLAAGTGIQTNRARNAESKLAAYLNSSRIDLGCSAHPNSVTATRYTSDFYGRPTFEIYCNSDAPNPPLQSFYVGTFDDCIDACASYSAYTSGNFPRISTSANFTCSAVSFIPDWTNRTEALMVNAPGNCYLKPGPQNISALTHPNADMTVVHAAILLSS